MEVFQARSEHLEEVSKLFDQYRVFYRACLISFRVISGFETSRYQSSM